MAGLPQTIPGFYFDVEKNKYFKITSDGISGGQKYDREHLKRKQASRTLREDVKSYETLKLQARYNIASNLLLGGEGSGRVDWLRRQYVNEPITRRNYRERMDIYRGLNLGSILPGLYYNSLEGRDNFITAAEDGIVYRFHDKDSSAHKLRSICCDFKEALPIKDASSSEIFGWILHLKGAYVLLNLKTPDIRLDISPHLEVYDALLFPCLRDNWKMISYTLNSKVVVLIVDTTNPGRILAKTPVLLPKPAKTDVLSITGEYAQKDDRATYDLFAGCRGGQIFRIWVEVNRLVDGRVKVHSQVKLFCNLFKPILALRNMGDLSYIAASVVDTPYQKLYLLNSIALSDNPVVAMFRARFQNMSRHTEIFQASLDGMYIIYGSTLANNKVGGLQIFCTNFEAEAVVRLNEKEQIPAIHEIANLDSLLMEFNVKRILAAAIYTSKNLEAADLEALQSTESGQAVRIFCMHNDNTILQHTRLALLCADNNDVGLVLRSFDID